MREDRVLTSDDIRSAAFARRARGFDREEVTGFLAQVADAYQSLLDRPPTFEHLGAEAGKLLQAACEGAESLRSQSEEDAGRIRREAQESADAVRLSAEREAAAALRDAQEARAAAEREAGALRDRATNDALETLREAEAESQRLREAVEREHLEALARAEERERLLTERVHQATRWVRQLEGALRSFRTRVGDEEASRSDDVRVEHSVGDLVVALDAREHPDATELSRNRDGDPALEDGTGPSARGALGAGVWTERENPPG